MRYAVIGWLTCMSVMACGANESGVSSQNELEDDFKGCPPETPEFGPGLQAGGAHHTLRLISAEPAEPERHDNDWVVELDPSDAVLVRGQTFMPIHGHDGRVDPVIKPQPQPGQFAIERLNFTMRGPWEVRLWLRSAAATEELVVLDVCVAE